MATMETATIENNTGGCRAGMNICARRGGGGDSGPCREESYAYDI